MKQYTGMDYLRIAVANHFGLDGQEFEHRINWVKENNNRLENMEQDAKDFYQYGAAVMALRKAQKGEPTGYLVGMDASASGPQILSVLTNCKTGAENTGAIGQTRRDVYKIMPETMLNYMDDKDLTASRKDIKYSFMPHFYSSKAQPKNLLGEDTPQYRAFYKALDDVCPGANRLTYFMEELWDDEALSYSWDYPDLFEVKCLVKDMVDTRVEIDTLEKHPTFTYRHTINTPLENGRFLLANLTHGADGFIVRELTARCFYNPEQVTQTILLLQQRLQTAGLDKPYDMLPKPLVIQEPIEQAYRRHNFCSIYGIEFINEQTINKFSVDYCIRLLQLLIKVMLYKSFPVISVHDEFKCHANHVNTVRMTYRDILAELTVSTTLSCILSSIAKHQITVDPVDSCIYDLVMESEYAIS